MKTKTTSFISESIILNGNLQVSGSLRIDGKVQGKIESKDTVTISETATVEAEIVAKNIITSGKVLGTVVANDRIVAHSPASLQGNIKTCFFEIEKGVFFQGDCEILVPINNPLPKFRRLLKPKSAIEHRKK